MPRSNAPSVVRSTGSLTTGSRASRPTTHSRSSSSSIQRSLESYQTSMQMLSCQGEPSIVVTWEILTLTSSASGVQSVQRRPMSTHAPTVIRRFVPINKMSFQLILLCLGMRHMQGCAQRHPEAGDLEGEQPDQARDEQDRGRPCTSREKPTAAEDKCRHGELHLLVDICICKLGW